MLERGVTGFEALYEAQGRPYFGAQCPRYRITCFKVHTVFDEIVHYFGIPTLKDCANIIDPVAFMPYEF